MTNSRWLRRAMLGGVALIVAGTYGARADELSDLKAQLEALESRVNTLEFRHEDNDDQLGWVVGAGANINLADIATFTVGAQYTEGLAARWMNQLESSRTVCEDLVVDPDTGDLICNDFNHDLQKAWGITGGLTLNVNDPTSINLEAGYAQNLDADENALLNVDNVVTVHGNILWQPVKQMRLGWEAMWGRNELVDNRIDVVEDGEVADRVCPLGNVEAEGEEHNHCPDSNEDFRLQFGNWFFF